VPPTSPLEDLIGRPLPALSLPDPEGRPFAIQAHVGHGPRVLFFFIRNGTPG